MSFYVIRVWCNKLYTRWAYIYYTKNCDKYRLGGGGSCKFCLSSKNIFYFIRVHQHVCCLDNFWVIHGFSSGVLQHHFNHHLQSIHYSCLQNIRSCWTRHFVLETGGVMSSEMVVMALYHPSLLHDSTEHTGVLSFIDTV